MTHILIVGKKFSGLVNKILDKGYRYTVLQDIAATIYPDRKFKNRIVTDFSSPVTMLEAVDALHNRKPIDAVMTVYENYILPTAVIGEHLGLPHLPVDAARACTDKFLMRSLFAKAPEKISPEFAIINSKEDLREFASRHEFPLILKPANLAKSLLVTKNNSLDELLANYKKSTDLLQSTYKKYAPNRTPKLIIEEFLQGSIHSVDAFIDNKGIPHILDQVVDYQTGYDIGYDDNFHYSRILPSRLSKDDQQAVRHCGDIGARALGMKSSPAHIEVILTKSGPRIVEIGARNGGYRERMHRQANGIDIIDAALAIAQGKVPDITKKKDEPCAVLELFPRQPGKFKGIQNFDKLTKLASLTYHKVKVGKGEFIGKAADGYKMTAVIILHHRDQAVFEKDLRYVTEEVSVLTD
jgi:biotin carboxylase